MITKSESEQIQDDLTAHLKGMPQELINKLCRVVADFRQTNLDEAYCSMLENISTSIDNDHHPKNIKFDPTDLVDGILNEINGFLALSEQTQHM